ncbi:MAG TPA: hypothetical protein OIL92_00875 [Oscillospiraceae bacterium]|nr:hypothetical protein [Oscillospiraceae bacterium]
MTKISKIPMFLSFFRMEFNARYKAEKPKKKPRQESLFYTQDDTSKYLSQNPVTGEYMAEPICEYPPINYRRL